VSKQEHVIQAEIQLAASDSGIPLFRNNVGAYKTQEGYYVRYGVGGAGGSDLIGIAPIVITPDMVGKTVGVFTAIEVKTKKGKPTEKQNKFIRSIKRLGAIAGVARSPAEAIEIIKNFKP